MLWITGSCLREHPSGNLIKISYDDGWYIKCGIRGVRYADTLVDAKAVAEIMANETTIDVMGDICLSGK